MQESLYETAEAEDSNRQRMQESLYQTADAGDTLSYEGHPISSDNDPIKQNLYL